MYACIWGENSKCQNSCKHTYKEFQIQKYFGRIQRNVTHIPTLECSVDNVHSAVSGESHQPIALEGIWILNDSKRDFVSVCIFSIISWCHFIVIWLFFYLKKRYTYPMHKKNQMNVSKACIKLCSIIFEMVRILIEMTPLNEQKLNTGKALLWLMIVTLIGVHVVYY